MVVAHREAERRIVQARRLVARDNAGCIVHGAVRSAAVYTVTAEAEQRGLRLNAVEVSVSPTAEKDRRVVNIFLSYAHRKTLNTERYVLGVDVTEKYPFLSSKLSRCHDNVVDSGV